MNQPASARSPIAIVLLTVLIDTIGLGIIIPVIPKLVMELAHVPTEGASLYGGWLAFSYAVTQFLFSPIVGGLSDCFGRRPVLLFSLLAFGVDYLIMGFAPHWSWLVVGRVIAGITGASHSTANAYLADITPPEQRAQRFGLIGAMFGIGFILGPALGGLLGQVHSRLPFFAAGVLALLNCLWAFAVLPESLRPAERRPFTLRRSNVLGALLQLATFPGVLGILLAIFLWQLAHQSLPSTWSYYTMSRYQWNEFQVGLSLAFVGVCMAVVQGGLTRKLIPLLGEYRAAIVGFAFGALGYAGYAFAPYGWVIYAVVAGSAIGGIGYPACNALLSKSTPSNSQGELQGILVSSFSLTAIVGPLLMTNVFYAFSRADAVLRFPGAAFLLSAILSLIGGAVFLFTQRRQPAMGDAAVRIANSE